MENTRLFDKLYKDLSQDELSKIKPSQSYQIDRRKDRLEAWLKTCLKGGLSAVEQNIGKLEDELSTLRSRLVNGDTDVLQAIVRNKLAMKGMKEQIPFLQEEYLEIFGENP